MTAASRLGLPCVVSIQGGEGHWVGSCCETYRLALVRVLDHAGRPLFGGNIFAVEVHDRPNTPPNRFTIVPGTVDTDRFMPALKAASEVTV